MGVTLTGKAHCRCTLYPTKPERLITNGATMKNTDFIDLLVNESIAEAGEILQESAQELSNDQYKPLHLALMSIATSMQTHSILLREQTKHLRDIADTLESMRHGE